MASRKPIHLTDAEIKLKQASVKERKCLNCRNKFKSESAGNRICKRCKTLDNWQTARYAFDC